VVEALQVTDQLATVVVVMVVVVVVVVVVVETAAAVPAVAVGGGGGGGELWQALRPRSHTSLLHSSAHQSV